MPKLATSGIFVDTSILLIYHLLKDDVLTKSPTRISRSCSFLLYLAPCIDSIRTEPSFGIINCTSWCLLSWRPKTRKEFRICRLREKKSWHLAILMIPVSGLLLKLLKSLWLMNGRTMLFDARHEKTDFKVFVVVIPKEGWAHVATPILLLVWHQLFRIWVFWLHRSYSLKVGIFWYDNDKDLEVCFLVTRVIPRCYIYLAFDNCDRSCHHCFFVVSHCIAGQMLFTAISVERVMGKSNGAEVRFFSHHWGNTWQYLRNIYLVW